jgi:hypothetical protein
VRPSRRVVLNAITSIALALACVFVVHWLRTRGQIPGPFEGFGTSRGGAEAWRYEEGGVVVSDLKGLTHTAPGASVSITNSSDSAQIVAVHLALYDPTVQGYKLVASCCLKAGDLGVVQPRATVTPVEMLPVSRRDMGRCWWVAIRVTRTKVTR